MEERNRSLQTELWHPYSRSEETHGGQGAADFTGDFTNHSYYPRLDRVASGL